MKKVIKVAIAGNPNVGKTSILNYIAGTRLKVGNWPGVTVEKKEAIVEFGGYELHFVDLPGIYTLEPISEDEKIAVEFLTREQPDVVLNVVDTTNFERNLLLTVELLEFGIPLVMALNMSDEAERLGIRIDKRRLKELLDVEVVETVGRTGRGTKELLKAIVETVEQSKIPREPTYSDDLEEILRKLKGEAKNATKHELLLELVMRGDKSLEGRKGKSILQAVKDERYAFAHGLTKEVYKREAIADRDLTDKIDKVVLHPFVGLLVLVGIIYLVFKLSFDLSSPFMDWVDGFINDFLAPLSLEVLTALSLPDWFLRFFSEAIVGGVGFVLTFVPLIAAIYFFITFLEMSGYIPRVAFLMDNFMHKIGLHGKSVIPLVMGFGCNVPAIIAARTMESRRDKFIVIAMIPFMSCPARLVVFAFFTSIFFREHSALVITSLYIVGILIALLTAFIFKKIELGGKLSHFVMELPPYRLPSLKSVMLIVWAHVREFLYRAGTLIFAASVIIWLLLNVPMNKPTSESVAAGIGKALVPVFEPIGIDDWRATTSLIPAFLAREIVISSMGTIYSATELTEEKEEDFQPLEVAWEQLRSLGEAVLTSLKSVLSFKVLSLSVDESEYEGVKQVIGEHFTPLSALSFMIFILIYTSCLGTFAVMVQEVGKLRGVLFLVYSFVLAWLVAFAVYNLGGFIV